MYKSCIFRRFSTIFTALFCPYIAHEQTDQNLILSVCSSLFFLLSVIAPEIKVRSRAKSDWAFLKSDVPSSEKDCEWADRQVESGSLNICSAGTAWYFYCLKGVDPRGCTVVWNTKQLDTEKRLYCKTFKWTEARDFRVLFFLCNNIPLKVAKHTGYSFNRKLCNSLQQMFTYLHTIRLQNNGLKGVSNEN